MIGDDLGLFGWMADAVAKRVGPSNAGIVILALLGGLVAILVYNVLV